MKPANGNPPYVWEQYNAVGCYPGINSHNRSVAARIFNELVFRLNKKSETADHRLPKYIVILPDRDLLMDINFNNFGIEKIIDDTLTWLAKNVDKTLRIRKEDMRKKQNGSLPPSIYPKVIWAKMLVRPFLKQVEKPFILSQCSKFNNRLERMTERFPNFHVMKV